MTGGLNILRSSKRKGKHEVKIIIKLIPFFENKGYRVIPHARFNIAWGNILSDIDLLLIKDQHIGVVEVKSSKDNLSRATRQIDNIKDYVDFMYIATDYTPRKFLFKDVGLIIVNQHVQIIKTSEAFAEKPRLFSINSIPKKCLCRIFDVKKIKYSKNSSKSKLARQILNNSQNNLKKELQQIVTCGLECDTQCPIWTFKHKQLSLVTIPSSSDCSLKIQ